MSEKNKKLCHKCDDCCRYIALELDRPTTINDYQNIIWFLLHQKVAVYIDWSNHWFIEFETDCSALKNKLCTIYDARPTMCREYQQHECTRYNKNKPEKYHFGEVAALKKYLKNNKPKIYKNIFTGQGKKIG
ncbi:MAG: YkgJ family cysteine cluster protein [Patescibacteria group bacterium]